MNGSAPIRAEDLHAYVDGELDLDRRAEVETWLADHPVEAARVARWTTQKEKLHAQFDGVLAEPVPGSMTDAVTAALDPPSVGSRRSWWKQAVAAAVFLAIGFGAGWGVRDVVPGMEGGRDFVQQAVGAHVVFTKENRHAVEVRADKEERHLVRWLSKRLGHPVQPPPLADAGFRLVGGRLVADPGGPAAQFMYENDKKQRVTLYVRRGGDGGKTAFRYVSQDGVAAFFWIDKPLSYALTAKMEREDLLRLARIVYDALGS